jgi:hypothetical protein
LISRRAGRLGVLCGRRDRDIEVGVGIVLDDGAGAGVAPSLVPADASHDDELEAGSVVDGVLVLGVVQHLGVWNGCQIRRSDARCERLG